MSDNEEITYWKKALEVEKERLEKLWELYQDTEQKVKELSSKIDEFELEINNLKRENLYLKEQFGIVHAGWQKKRDMAWRINPSTGVKEVYKELPLEFDESNIIELDFYGDDYYRFRYHYIREDYIWYTIPISLYEFLCEGELKINENKKEKKEIQTKMVHLDITSQEDMKNHIKKYGFYHYNYDYFNIATEFILKFKEKEFETKDFRRECKIKSPATVSKHLKMFEKCNVINKIKQGLYKVNIN